MVFFVHMTGTEWIFLVAVTHHKTLGISSRLSLPHYREEFRVSKTFEVRTLTEYKNASLHRESLKK